MTSGEQLVLFVCVHNSARSKMAEAIFNEEIKSKNINAMAKSAGTNPSNEVHSFAKVVLQEIGIEINNKPIALNDTMIEDANIIINMGCMENDFCPAIFVDKIITFVIMGCTIYFYHTIVRDRYKEFLRENVYNSIFLI